MKLIIPFVLIAVIFIGNTTKALPIPEKHNTSESLLDSHNKHKNESLLFKIGFGIGHGAGSLVIVSSLTTLVVLVFDVNFDPFKNMPIGLLEIFIESSIEDPLGYYLLLPGVRYLVSNSYGLYESDESIKRQISNYILCFLVGVSIHIFTPYPSFIHSALCTGYCMSLLSVWDEHGIIAGTSSRVIFNWIGFKLINILKMLR